MMAKTKKIQSLLTKVLLIRVYLMESTIHLKKHRSGDGKTLLEFQAHNPRISDPITENWKVVLSELVLGLKRKTYSLQNTNLLETAKKSKTLH